MKDIVSSAALDLVAFISEKTTPPDITQPLGGVYNERLIDALKAWAKKHDLVLGVCDPNWRDRLDDKLSKASSEELLGELGKRFDNLRVGMLPGAPR